MKPSHAANLALVLVVLGWLLSAYGALSQLGDPSPLVPRAEMESHRRASAVILVVGVLTLLSALWLSGYSFLVARWRASVALLACVLPFIAPAASTFV
jgi:hypothetical protein